MKKTIIITSLSVLVLLAGFLFFRYYFVFGEGVKTGELNNFMYKGYVFKTYEGKIIQTGLKSQTSGAIQSNEFIFSVEDAAVADSLMRCTGKIVELRYKEYFGALPWRGMQKQVVYQILSVKEPQTIR